MKRSISKILAVLVVGLVVGLLASASLAEEHEKVWRLNDHALTTDDFQGQVPDPDDTDLKAESSVFQSYNYTLSAPAQRNGQGKFETKAKVTTETKFLTGDSFFDPPLQQEAFDALLNHEQGHFDLAEVHRRVLQKQLEKLVGRGDTPAEAQENFQEQLNGVLDRYFGPLDEDGMRGGGEFDQEQDLYDSEEETNHGTNPSKQQEWDKKIRDWLASDTEDDLVYHYLGTPTGFATALADFRDVALWQEVDHIVMAMELYGSIPVSLSEYLLSWHFLLDIDSDPNTGWPGWERPVGVFPGLGIEVWVDFLGPIDGSLLPVLFFMHPDFELTKINVPGVIEAALNAERNIITMRVPVAALEAGLSALYETEIVIDPASVTWVAVTNYCATEADCEDPPSDFFPDELYCSETDTPTDPDTDGLDNLTEFSLRLNPCDSDTDGDGCSDPAELKGTSEATGQRNPSYPFDYYDVSVPRDGVIDLANDILGVILHFSPFGLPPYDVNFDRGPSEGPNAWNMTAPDGVIDLANDILGVILQYNPSGCQPGEVVL